jgi:hypothetical protein
MTKKELSDEEMMELIKLIGKPTIEFMLKRIQNKIIQDKKHALLPINSFLSVIIGSLAILNASTLKWLSASTNIRLGESIDIDKLRLALIQNINDQLGIKIN